MEDKNNNGSLKDAPATMASYFDAIGGIVVTFREYFPDAYRERIVRYGMGSTVVGFTVSWAADVYTEDPLDEWSGFIGATAGVITGVGLNLAMAPAAIPTGGMSVLVTQSAIIGMSVATSYFVEDMA